MGRRKAAASPSPSRQVRSTGSSSAASKGSAAALGYTRDRFALKMLPPGGRRRRRAPVIHRGYYARAQAVEHCVRAFLLSTQGCPRRQIISLGAGFDSFYFFLKSEGLLDRAVIFEVDFPDVVCHKSALISRTEELAALTGNGASAQALGVVTFSGEDYRLLGVDLSELPRLEEALHGAGLDPKAPTMLLAEVVLTYMEVERSDALVQWAAEHFLKVWFILYEQVHPEDPFGCVMRNHFSRLNSQLRSLAHYPDCKAQRMRFLQRGWTECSVLDMNEFYTHFVPGDEQQRIQALEPFDEFEEWHLKCSHYFILVASKGEALSPTPVFPGLEASSARCLPYFTGTVTASVCASVTGLRRYGHRSVIIAPHVVLTTGGFGEHGGRHCRLTELHVLIKHKGVWRTGSVSLAKPGGAWDGRLFHTLTPLRAGWAVVLGGRKSPVDPAVEVQRLRVLEAADPLASSSPVVELTPLPPVKDLPLPRWRHTATEVVHQGEAYLFVYGGCCSRQSVLADWCFLHLEEELCDQQIPVGGPVPAGRHSHSACSWAGGVLVAGGLDAAEQPLGTILFLRPAERGFQWHSIETHPPLTPRYSHTAHVHRGKLLLVGGVWFHAPSVPGMAVIDLTTGLAAEYHIDTASLEWPLMLHNHSSVFLPEEEEVLLLGGGGSCFSFGTHLNQYPVSLALADVWSEECVLSNPQGNLAHERRKVAQPWRGGGGDGSEQGTGLKKGLAPPPCILGT
ncbi:tRNA wybutosine-synthesizing protein 4 isoform X2 [Rhineura floridana]|uniref:tRNA wybutosine-synthesizing protein 4 isoform X2 n=1 Tax=Rhineura floridana TaxID=261503 RepID=UPI002AC82348|nr:tRNA wybutosine-synthesizing protein 4 isoform X2 [Rhineura floridana]